MNDAPETIWVKYSDQYYDGVRGIFITDDYHEGYTPMIRADRVQAELQAAVAAERVAIANMAYDHLTHSRNPMREELAGMIYERTVDTDAQTALEAVKCEARNDALARAWSIADQNGDVKTATDLQKIITEGQSNE